MDFPTLYTERLILREWQDEDAANIYEIFQHESVVRYTWLTPYESPEDGMRRVSGSREFLHTRDMGITWGIFDKSSSRVLGDIDFTYRDRENRKVMLGCCFAPHAWGNGFATEAMREVIRYAFEDFPLYEINRLQAETDPRNTPANKLLERVGFAREAVLRDYCKEKGVLVDQCIYGLLRSDLKS